MLHDLHESVPFLYDNTIGDGPFNAWIDPLLTNEWQMIGWNNVQEMTRMGMPGVFAHGTFDTWSPGYLMFIAATHNGISRLYETFGNGGTAETVERTLSPEQTSRTWYRQNPPLPKVKWSLRNNNNYEQTGVLVSLNYFATNRRQFLENFYQKSKRSVHEGEDRGAGGVRAAGGRSSPGRAGRAAARAAEAGGGDLARDGAVHRDDAASRVGASRQRAWRGRRGQRDARRGLGARRRARRPTTRTFPAGSYIIRMDQPYSRIADALLDYQYWSPNDPQKNPYDDTGWTFPEGFNVQAVRVTDPKVLDAPMERVTGEIKSPGGVTGTGNVFAINHNGDNALATLRYRLAKADFQAPRSRSRRGDRSSRAGRSSSAASRRRSSTRRRRSSASRCVALATRAERQDASGARRARRDHAHVAQHADRGLVASGVRPAVDSVRLHQHAGRREERRT